MLPQRLFDQAPNPSLTRTDAASNNSADSGTAELSLLKRPFWQYLSVLHKIAINQYQKRK